MDGTLLLPVPPDHGDEAKSALEAAVNDDEEVEVSVLLAADADGKPTSVCFASVAALSAWSPRGTASLPLPARIAIGNMAAAGVPAIMDPAGPIPYRFEPDELASLAAGRLPGTDEPLAPPSVSRSIRLRLAGREAMVLEPPLRDALRQTDVDAAWLVESESDGARRLMLGLLGGEGASAVVDVPDGTDVVWLEEPLLASVRAVSEPFYRRGRDERGAAGRANRGVARVTLTRPEVRNTFNAELIASLRTTFERLRNEPPEQAARGRAERRGEGVLRRGGHRVAAHRRDLPMKENEADIRRLQEMLATIDNCPVPVVAAVHGAALGGGMALCCVADITLATADAIFGFTEVKLGLIPAAISPFVLPAHRRGTGARALPDRGAVRLGAGAADRRRVGGAARPGRARRAGHGDPRRRSGPRPRSRSATPR